MVVFGLVAFTGTVRGLRPVREAPVDGWVEVGVFAPAAPGAGALSAPLHVAKHRLRSPRQTIAVTVPHRPALAGLDPYHLLDWHGRAEAGNVEPVVAGN